MRLAREASMSDDAEVHEVDVDRMVVVGGVVDVPGLHRAEPRVLCDRVAPGLRAVTGGAEQGLAPAELVLALEDNVLADRRSRTQLGQRLGTESIGLRPPSFTALAPTRKAITRPVVRGSGGSPPGNGVGAALSSRTCLPRTAGCPKSTMTSARSAGEHEPVESDGVIEEAEFGADEEKPQARLEREVVEPRIRAVQQAQTKRRGSTAANGQITPLTRIAAPNSSGWMLGVGDRAARDAGGEQFPQRSERPVLDDEGELVVA